MQEWASSPLTKQAVETDHDKEEFERGALTALKAGNFSLSYAGFGNCKDRQYPMCSKGLCPCAAVSTTLVSSALQGMEIVVQCMRCSTPRTGKAFKDCWLHKCCKTSGRRNAKVLQLFPLPCSIQATAILPEAELKSATLTTILTRRKGCMHVTT